PRALPGQPGPARVEEHGGRAAALRREPGTPAHEVGVERAARERPARHDALLAALAEPTDGTAREVEVVDVEAHGLADARAGRVHELEERAVAQGRGTVTEPGGVEDARDLVRGDRLRQAPALGRGAHV